MVAIPKDKSRHVMLKNAPNGSFAALTDDQIKNMGAHITHHPDGEISYTIIDKVPDENGVNQAHVCFSIDSLGKVKSAAMMDMGAGAIGGHGEIDSKDLTLKRNAQIDESKFNNNAQKLLDIMNTLQPQDYLVEPTSRGHAVQPGPLSLSPMNIRSAALAHMEETVLSQKQLFGLNYEEMAADVPRLSSLQLRPNMSPSR